MDTSQKSSSHIVVHADSHCFRLEGGFQSLASLALDPAKCLQAWPCTCLYPPLPYSILKGVHGRSSIIAVICTAFSLAPQAWIHGEIFHAVCLQPPSYAPNIDSELKGQDLYAVAYYDLSGTSSARMQGMNPEGTRLTAHQEQSPTNFLKSQL